MGRALHMIRESFQLTLRLYEKKEVKTKEEVPTAWLSVEVKPQHIMMIAFRKRKRNELIWVEEASPFMTAGHSAKGYT